jgi:ATP-binding cassette subfamily F protein uup
VWLRRGVKARRTRDEGRVKALMAMRAERAERRNRAGNVRLNIDSATRRARWCSKRRDVAFSYGSAPVVQRLLDARDARRSHRADRSQRRRQDDAAAAAAGRAAPTQGEVRRGANVQVAYYDQQREQLDPDRTVVDTIGDGNDTVTVNGQPRHVHGYLQDFLFSPERARSPVRALSGGERNRLLLARLLTRPRTSWCSTSRPTISISKHSSSSSNSSSIGRDAVTRQSRSALLDNVVTSTLASRATGSRGVRWRVRGLLAAASVTDVAGAKTAGPRHVEAPKTRAGERRRRTFKEEREVQRASRSHRGARGEQKTLQASLADPTSTSRAAR